jgi:predicted AlkP superfamily pyrophosphatase or phosphodiesterase
MRKLLFTGLLCLYITYAYTQADSTQQITAGRSNSIAQQQKPYVILISADGFRYDLADKYNAAQLIQLRNSGVAARGMTPSYPSLTFPNHYAIATGLYPSHHGLVDNTFWDKKMNKTYKISIREAVEDSSFYGGTPIWVLAEQQQLLSASFYWVGSEAAIKGVRPTYYYKYNEKIDIDARIQAVKDWLTLPEEKRPHLVTFYFPEVDHAEHTYGTEAKETAEAVQFIDQSVARMVRMTDSLHLPVNYIFVSDHGMTNVDTLHYIPFPKAIDTTRFRFYPSDVLLHLYANNKKFVRSAYNALKKQATDFDVYYPDQTPAYWHYTSKDDRYNRIGDIILVPHLPRVFGSSGRRITPGKHGLDNALPEMRATFYAWGPAFKEHLKIEPFENVHVYPLVAKILGLNITEKIDGSLQVLAPILK